MKIKEVLVESFKSPFFNLLAIANLILITITFSDPSAHFVLTPVNKLALALNLPALATSRILSGPILQNFALVPPLVYLQWILIGAFAKFVSARLKPASD